MLEKSQIKNLSQLAIWRTWISLSIDWVVILATIYVVIRWPHPVVVLLAMLILARQQLALAILMHDAAHGRFFKNIRFNHFMGQVFCASPLFFSLDIYREKHLQHHVNPLASDDPDLSLIGGYPISKKSFTRKILRDLLGVSYLKFIKYFFFAKKKPHQSVGNKTTQRQRQMGLLQLWFWHVVVNGGLVVYCAYLGNVGYYLLLWFLPMMTMLQVLLRIRGIAEHAGYQPNPDQRLNARTVLPSWQTTLFAPHQVNYHVEHHLYPSVPYYRLPQLHHILVDQYDIPKDHLFANYQSVIQVLCS